MPQPASFLPSLACHRPLPACRRSSFCPSSCRGFPARDGAAQAFPSALPLCVCLFLSRMWGLPSLVFARLPALPAWKGLRSREACPAKASPGVVHVAEEMWGEAQGGSPPRLATAFSSWRGRCSLDARLARPVSQPRPLSLGGRETGTACLLAEMEAPLSTVLHRGREALPGRESALHCLGHRPERE